MKANYKTEGLHYSYVGNPLIEALPRMLSAEEYMVWLARRPKIDIEKAKKLPAHMRQHDVRQIGTLFMPPNKAAEIGIALDIEIAQGLLRRAPFEPGTQRYLDSIRAEMKKEELRSGAETSTDKRSWSEEPSGSAIFLVGPSGTGKTTIARSLLMRYDQIITHTTYKRKRFRQKQIVWLSVDAPVNGTIMGFCNALLMQIDSLLELSPEEGYARQFTSRKITVGEVMSTVAQIAATHYLGLLHIDDIQRCAPGKGDGIRLLEFVISLANVVRCPLLISGTSKATRIFAKSFEAGRRISSGGYFEMSLPEEAADENFLMLLNALFKFQLLDVQVDINERPDLIHLIYAYSQGVSAVVVLLYRAALSYALRTKAPSLSADCFHAAYLELKPLHIALEKLKARRNDDHALDEYEDLISVDETIRKLLMKEPSYG